MKLPYSVTKRQLKYSSSKGNAFTSSNLSNEITNELRSDSGDKERKHRNKNKIIWLQDTALIISILTAMCYFLSFSYEKGIRDYYGINDIAVSEFNLSSIMNSINNILPIIFSIGIVIMVQRFILTLIYSLSVKVIFFISFLFENLFSQREPNLKTYVREKMIKEGYYFFKHFLKEYYEQRKYKVSGVMEVMNVMTLVISIFASLIMFIFTESFNSIGDIFFTESLPRILLPSLKPICIFLFCVVLVVWVYVEDEIDHRRWFVSRFVRWVNGSRKTAGLDNWSLKILLIIAFGVCISYITYQFGYTSAEQREDYIILKINDKDMVVLDSNKELMLLASLENINRRDVIANDNFQILELKNDKEKQFIFEKKSFKKGLPVKDNKRNKVFESVLETLF
ncbi:hypothetical protein [Priestia megaterium]|uniref:hypothetical protein n=1 Tax=Priestia megaterium TaxID=1404 RepID=UPI00234E3927|nr:hypothetical protein [Priestia megaterium]MDC7781853.1 hypothetical protein [Priestia megaterium]